MGSKAPVGLDEAFYKICTKKKKKKKREREDCIRVEATGGSRRQECLFPRFQ